MSIQRILHIFFFFFVGIIVITLIVLWNRQSDSFVLPSGDEQEARLVIEDGEVVGTVTDLVYGENADEELAQAIRDAIADAPTTKDIEIKDIYITDGLKHSVPLDEIVGGGPEKDGIPSIDAPVFISISEAESFLDDSEPGISVSLNGIDRFYPFQIMVWHEIVNDTFDDTAVLVTYCPLCLTGIVFDPLVLGEYVEFGTSGKLWQSNLVMYDRKTDSLWSQVLGEAIAGEMTGTALSTFPSDRVRFGDWKEQYPQGEVLSRDTGALRTYGFDPYGSYYTDNSQIFSDVSTFDDRLQRKDVVMGLVIDGVAKAYYPPSIQEEGIVQDTVGSRVLEAEYFADLDVVRIYEVLETGERVQLNPVSGFWFSWVAAHPDTLLYQ
ncbi:MAG: DUF3179 domain-containing protein [Patescibacteria group bacterium]